MTTTATAAAAAKQPEPGRRRRRPSAVAVAVGLLGAALIVGGGALFLAARSGGSREGSLLRRATPIVSAPVWQGVAPGSAPPSGGKYLSPFYWLSDHEILRFAKQGTGAGATQTPVILDVTTGKARQIPRTPDLAMDQKTLSVSPNGEWLLCMEQRGATKSRLFALALDGTGRRRIWADDYDDESEIILWLRENAGFVSFRYDVASGAYGEARVYRMNKERSEKMTRVVKRKSLMPMGQLPSGRFLGYHYTGPVDGASGAAPPKTTTAATLTEFSVAVDSTDATGAAVPLPPPRDFVIPAPLVLANPGPRSGGGVSGVLETRSSLLDLLSEPQLSPQGDRILLVVRRTEYVSRSDSFATVYRALPKRLRPRRPRSRFLRSYDVFVARVDGRGGLTHLGVSAPQEVETVSPGDGAHWTPDGKRVAFIYNKALWTVPVEAP